MKKEIKLSEISQKLNISKSTVSKALNNKGGVDPATKQEIINCARKFGYFYNHTDKTQVNILIPARFKNHCAYIQNIFKEKNLNAKCGIYTNYIDYLQTLNTLKKSDCDILLIYPCQNGDNQILKTLTKKFAVWFICDVINIENTFYFGNNPKSSANLLINEFSKSNHTAPAFIVFEDEFIYKITTATILSALNKKYIRPACVINLNGKGIVSDAVIARRINTVKNFDSVYCSAKIVGQTFGALKKLSKTDIPVFAFDETQILLNCIETAAKNAENYILNNTFPICKYNINKPDLLSKTELWASCSQIRER